MTSEESCNQKRPEQLKRGEVEAAVEQWRTAEERNLWHTPTCLDHSLTHFGCEEWKPSFALLSKLHRISAARTEPLVSSLFPILG